MSLDGFIAGGGKVVAIVVGLGLLGYSGHLIWVHILRPVNRLLVNVNEFAESIPVLADIAHEFKPNHGTSLRDQVDIIRANSEANSIRLDNIEQQLEVHIIGGRPWDGSERRDIE